jgi:hypothetical protein
MKPISQGKALIQLTRMTNSLRQHVAENYEHKAASCLTCSTPGACCLDADFVNVRISRLEAVRIGRSVEDLPAATRRRVEERISEAIKLYGLEESGPGTIQTFACPLFEVGTGCLVHHSGKPVPCVMHGCYEDAPDLPPDALQDEAELAIARLNSRTYGRDEQLLPLPLALKRWLPTAGAQ